MVAVCAEDLSPPTLGDLGDLGGLKRFCLVFRGFRELAMLAALAMHGDLTVRRPGQ